MQSLYHCACVVSDDTHMIKLYNSRGSINFLTTYFIFERLSIFIHPRNDNHLCVVNRKDRIMNSITEKVKKYYGKELKSVADLKTNSCIDCGENAPWVCVPPAKASV